VLLSERVGAEGFEHGQNLSGERLVELDHVDVVKGEAGLLEHLRNRVGRAQEQLRLRVLGDVRVLPEGGARRKALGLGHVRGHEKGGGRPVCEGRRCARRNGAERLDERGGEVLQLVHGGIVPDHVVGRDRVKVGRNGGRSQFFVEAPVVAGLGRPSVGAEGVPVLVLPRNAEHGREPIRTLAHHVPGGKLSNCGGLRQEIARAEAVEQIQVVAGALGLAGLKQAFPHRALEANGRVAEGLGAARDHDAHLSGAEEVDPARHGLVAGDAGHSDGEGGHSVGNTRS